MGNPLYDWTGENYDVFLDLAFEKVGFSEWKRNILKRIAKNDDWYQVQKYRREANLKSSIE